MSYINDREKMNKEAEAHRKKIWWLIKVTFVIFGALLLIFCVTFLLSTLFGIGAPKDKTAPTIDGPSRVIGYVGENPAYKQMVEVSDDKDPAPRLEVNHDTVDINTPGEYKVHYYAEDEAGNRSEIFTLTYAVKSREYHMDTLMERIEELSAELGITKSMTKKEQVRKIYSYVNSEDTVHFTDESNIPNIKRSNWGDDWIEEAIRTLDSGEGDCYSYYSLSKAFFEYFGIKNEGIKRSTRSTQPGTHFWHVVEIEEGWYYYDATSLRGHFESDGSQNACLITQAKLDSYKTSDEKDIDDFYKMDIKKTNVSKKELD